MTYDSEIFPPDIKTQHQKVLYLLRRAGPAGVSCGEFLQTSLGAEYRARMTELRQEGFNITCELHRGGKSIYRLIETRVEKGQFVFA